MFITLVGIISMRDLINFGTVTSVTKTANVSRLICDLEAIQAINGMYANQGMNALPIDPRILELLIWKHLGILWRDVCYYSFKELSKDIAHFPRKLNSIVIRALCFFQKNYTAGDPPFRAQAAILNVNNIELHHVGRKDPNYHEYSIDWTLRERRDEMVKGDQVALTRGAHLEITNREALTKKGHSVSFTQEQMLFAKLRECIGLIR